MDENVVRAHDAVPCITASQYRQNPEEDFAKLAQCQHNPDLPPQISLLKDEREAIQVWVSDKV